MQSKEAPLIDDRIRLSVKYVMSEVVTERLVISDYIELCKPKVVLLMLLCVIVGICLASPSGVPLDVLLFCTVGVGLVASSAAVINHLADSHIDAKMARTQNRPVATGRVGQREGLIFAAILGVAGMLVLWFLTNPLTALLNLCSWVGYGLVYTFFLKRATSKYSYWRFVWSRLLCLAGRRSQI